MQDMKTAIVTGANAGLGFEITKALADRHYRVIMACRNNDKAKHARELILREYPDAAVEAMTLDLSELDSVSAFVSQYRSRIGELDLLVNNAGIALAPLSRNSRDIEMHLATNYLGVFALTCQLVPLLLNSAEPRVVNVGSLAHRFGASLDFQDMNWESTDYSEWKAYARSKLALQSFTLELWRRLQQESSKLMVLGAHPGFANTEIGRTSRQLERKNAVSRWFHEKMEKRVPTPAKAARAAILAATSGHVQGGEYYGPGGFLEISGEPALAKISKRALNQDDARKLWGWSEEQTGVKLAL